MMESDEYDGWRRSVEDQFFQERDKALIDELKSLKKMGETKEALKKASGIQNDHVLEILVKHNVRPETVAAMAFSPLVEVAWADGEIQAEERTVLLNALEDCGIARSSTEHAAVESWLSHRPPKESLEAWSHYVKGLCEQLTVQERKELKEAVMKNVHRMAQAHGGFLGLIGDKTSPEEKRTIARIESAFSV